MKIKRMNWHKEGKTWEVKVRIRLKKSRAAFLDGLEPVYDGFAVDNGFLNTVLQVVAVLPYHVFFFWLLWSYLRVFCHFWWCHHECVLSLGFLIIRRCLGVGILWLWNGLCFFRGFTLRFFGISVESVLLGSILSWLGRRVFGWRVMKLFLFFVIEYIHKFL